MSTHEYAPRFTGHRIVGGLAGVRFASPDAEELAREYALTAADFDGIEPSRKTGYGVADVHEIVDQEEA